MSLTQPCRGRPRSWTAAFLACILVLLLTQPHAALGGGRTTRTLLQTDGGTGGTEYTVTTASATLPGDVAAVRSCLPFNILILPGPAPSSAPSTGGGGGGTPSTAPSTGGGAPTNVTTEMPAQVGGGNVTAPATGELGGGGNVTTGTPAGAAGGLLGPTTMPGGGGGGNVTAPTNVTGGGGGEGGGNATIVMQADMDVINATEITYSQQDGILSLALGQGYQTSHVINFTIYTANASSLRFVQNFGPGNLVVGPGFNVDTFSAAATTLGGILAKGVTAGHAYITNTGLGTVALNGTFRDADIVAGGTAKIYLAGNTSGTVTVSADGISTTWVQGSKSTQITGTANGLAKVVYTEGTCTVEPAFKSIFGVNIFGDPCQKSTGGGGPTLSTIWSCGQEVDGRSVCPEVQTGGASGVGLGGGTTQAASTGTGGGGNINTVTGEPGTISTGTYTTPGGTASASGTVSGPTGSLGAGQTSTGGSPPAFSASAFPPMPDIFSPSLGSGLDPNFMGNFGGSTGSSAFAGAISTGSPATASAINTGGPPVTAIASGSPSGLSNTLSIPSTGSGLAIRSTTCADPSSSRDMLPYDA